MQRILSGSLGEIEMEKNFDKYRVVEDPGTSASREIGAIKIRDMTAKMLLKMVCFDLTTFEATHWVPPLSHDPWPWFIFLQLRWLEKMRNSFRSPQLIHPIRNPPSISILILRGRYYPLKTRSLGGRNAIA